MKPASSATPNRKQLGLILLVAGFSLGGAYLLFWSASQGSGWGTTNRGTFVKPPRMSTNLDIHYESGDRFDPAGSWWLWVVTDTACAVQCQQALHQLRQLHILLNRDAGRVQRALVTAAAVGSGELRDDDPSLARLSGAPAELESGIYIVDPIGNLVLWYPFADAGEPVLDDLKRLLKVSQIG